jgi:hypothetical protein
LECTQFLSKNWPRFFTSKTNYVSRLFYRGGNQPGHKLEPKLEKETATRRIDKEFTESASSHGYFVGSRTVTEVVHRSRTQHVKQRNLFQVGSTEQGSSQSVTETGQVVAEREQSDCSLHMSTVIFGSMSDATEGIVTQKLKLYTVINLDYSSNFSPYRAVNTLKL